MKFYVIRHKATQELMPQAKKKSGYTHWNPAKKQTSMDYYLNTPRLFAEKKKAIFSIAQWFSNPNLCRRASDNPENFDLGMRSEDDGRSKEDLEIVEVELVIKEGKGDAS